MRGSGLLIQAGQNKNGHLLALGSSLALVAGMCIRTHGYMVAGVLLSVREGREEREREG